MLLQVLRNVDLRTIVVTSVGRLPRELTYKELRNLVKVGRGKGFDRRVCRIDGIMVSLVNGGTLHHAYALSYYAS